MTEAEAGEEILSGQPYMKCNSCKGQGEIPMEATTRINPNGKTFQSVRMAQCHGCFGKGTLVNHLWHEAARVLGMKIPPHPPRPNPSYSKSRVTRVR